MTEPLSVQQMAQRLKSADNILILCHKNPDGDTVGCGSALYYALKALDKNAAVLCSDTIPARYAFTNAHLFKGEFEPETVIAVDVAGLQLFGEGNGVPRYSRHVDLCIDHHAGNSGYADFTLLDGSAAAAAEPVAISSLYSKPGVRQWQWVSINAGRMVSPFALITSPASGRSVPIALILPSAIR